MVAVVSRDVRSLAAERGLWAEQARTPIEGRKIYTVATGANDGPLRPEVSHGTRIWQARRKTVQGHEVSPDRSLSRRAFTDRSGNPGRSLELLLRSDWRRSLEVHRRRHDVVAGFR